MKDRLSALEAESRAVREAVERLTADVARMGRQAFLAQSSQQAAAAEVARLPEEWARLVRRSGAVLEGELRQTARTDAARRTVTALLPLKDAYSAAGRMLPGDAQPEWPRLFAALESRLDGILAGFGARPLAEAGGAFRPETHEAIEGVASGAAAGTVLEVLRQGYSIGGDVLRPAGVRVSMGPAWRPTSASDDGPAGPGDGPREPEQGQPEDEQSETGQSQEGSR